MNKREIIAYFDARAPEWDARMVRSDSKIAFILDAAGVRPGVSVLERSLRHRCFVRRLPGPGRGAGDRGGHLA